MLTCRAPPLSPADIRTSSDLNREFRGYLETRGRDLGPADISVKVLTYSQWPSMQPAGWSGGSGVAGVGTSGGGNGGGDGSGDACALPAELEGPTAAFAEFYTDAKHSGRRLMWQTHLGEADLKVTVGGERSTLTSGLGPAS